MTDQSLILAGEQAISFTTEAEVARVSALAAAGAIGKVSNAEDNDRAVKAQTELTELVRLVERARKNAKEPIIEAGRKLDAAVKNWLYEVESELRRVSELVSEFAEHELRRQQAEERAKQAELNRIERERAEALAQTKNLEALDAVNETFDRKAAELSVPVETSRAPRQVIKEDWEIEVTNIYELARYHPYCVKMTPLLSEIKQMLDNGMTVHGVKAEKKVKAGIRAGKQPGAITI